MSMLRAAERQDQLAIQRVTAWYPHLSRWTSPIQLDSIRDHAIQLARSDIFDRISELRDMQLDTPSFATQALKENILVRLKRLIPGQSTTLSALKSSNGSIVNDPDDMARVLNDHWGEVFSRKNVRLDRLSSWLTDVPSLPATRDVRWGLTKSTLNRLSSVRKKAPQVLTACHIVLGSE